jgi:hypothetical protein
MNHQIDAVEWTPFDQKRLLRFARGIPSCLLTRPGLLQPTRGASLTPMLRIDDFVKFQNMFLRMNHQIDATEWPPFDQKIFRPGIPFSTLARPSLPHLTKGASWMPTLRIDNFVEFQTMFLMRMNEARQMIENELATDYQTAEAKRRKGGTSPCIKEFNRKCLQNSQGFIFLS